MSDENPTSTSLSTVLGGVHLAASFRDGTTETVLVRELPVRELPAYLLILDDEAATIELFCGKPAGWTDKITNSSALEILTAGEEANLSFLGRFLARRMARQKKAIPDLDGHIQRLAEALLIANGVVPPSPISASPSA